MEQYKRVYAAIDLDAIEYNLKSIKNNISKDTKIMAVIKTDAYGHGAVQVAHKIEQNDFLIGFAVATAEERLFETPWYHKENIDSCAIFHTSLTN